MIRTEIIAEWRKPNNFACVTAEKMLGTDDICVGFTHRVKAVEIRRFKSEEAALQYYRKRVREISGSVGE